MSDSPKQLGTFGLMRLVWRISGGAKALLCGFDFWLAFAVWLLSTPFWLTSKWPDQVIAVLPNLLGFTLGGFAIFLGFGSDDFKGAIAKRDELKSPYLSVSAAFMCFVFFQITALMYAIVANALYFETPTFLMQWLPRIKVLAQIGGGVGYLIFCYSLALVFRAAIRIFRLSRWYNIYLTPPAKPEGIPSCAPPADVSPSAPH